MNALGTMDPLIATRKAIQVESLYEVVHGVRLAPPPTSIYATWIADQIYSCLDHAIKQGSLGRVVQEALFILDPISDTRRRPDVAFVSADKWPMDRPLPETGDWEVVPDLAVEVISPNDIFEDALAKMHEYFEFGVRQVWIVSRVNKEIYVYTSPTELRILSAAEELDGGLLLPRARFRVGSIFQS